MTVSLGNGVDIGNIVTAETNPLTGRSIFSGSKTADVSIGDTSSFTRKILLIGDSITEARTPNFKWVKGASGYYKKKEWAGTGPTSNSTTFPQLNISGYPATFLDTIRGNSGCVGSEAFNIDYDGVSKLRASLNTEQRGEWVDVTGGGWFELLSGGGVKGLLVTVRWAMKPPSVGTGSGTLPASQTFENPVTGLASPYFPSIAKLGYADHDIYSLGIAGDKVSEIRLRNHMAVGLAPDIACIHAGINSMTTTDIADFVAIISELNAVGTHVVISTFLPYDGLTTAALAQQYVAKNNAILSIPKNYPALKVSVIDGAGGYINPRVAFGAGVITATDYVGDGLHPCLASISNKFTPNAFEILGKLLPKQRVRLATAMDTWDVTLNPSGNRAGTPGAFIGAGGTLGATPVPSGAVPTGWVDSTTTPANPFTSVVYTEPDNGAAIVRDDAPGTWFRAQYNTATVGNADRMLKATLANTFAAGEKYRLHLTVRLKNSSWLRMFQASLYFGSTGGRAYQAHAPLNAGLVPSITGSVITDTGPMYLASDPITVPPDYNGTAYVTVWVIAGLGGSVDMYLADCIVERIF